MPSPNHRLTPGDIAELDQAAEGIKADLDDILAGSAIRQAVAEDGPTIAAARLSLTLHDDFPHMGCAGLAAWAILRLVQGGESS